MPTSQMRLSTDAVRWYVFYRLDKHRQLLEGTATGTETMENAPSCATEEVKGDG